MRILPRVVQTLITSTPDATRIRDGMTAAVQPTLDFLNTYFQAGADNTLQVMRGVKFLGRVIANGGLNVNGDTVMFGNFYCRTRTGNGFVITPGPGTNPTFYITNAANNDALVLVDATGNLSAVSLSSRQGIKNVIKVGSYWNTAPGANTTFSFGDTVQNVQNASMGFTPFYYKWSHAGSVVGVSVNEAGPNTASKTIYVYKNNAEIFRWTTGAAGNNATFWTTFAKGQYSFAAGDTMNVYGSVGSTANTQLMTYLTLEMAA